MGRWNGSTRSWSNSSTSSSTRGRMTGASCFHWQSSSTTTTYIPPHNKLPSCLTLEDTCRWALSHTRWSPNWKWSMSSKTRWCRVHICSDKVNPNIFHFYFYFSSIFHHTSMHPLLCNFHKFYLIFLSFISPFIIYQKPPLLEAALAF